MREVLVVSLKKSEFEPLFIVSRPISERASMPSSPLAALEEAERRLGRLSVTPARVDGGVLRCGGCGELVTGRYLVAPNKKAFHPDCLRLRAVRRRVQDVRVGPEETERAVLYGVLR